MSKTLKVEKTKKRMQNDTKERENRGSLFPRVKKSMSG